MSYHHLPEYRNLVKRLVLEFSKITGSVYETPCTLETPKGTYAAIVLVERLHGLGQHILPIHYVWCEGLEPRRFLFIGSGDNESCYEIHIPAPKRRKKLEYELNVDAVLHLQSPVLPKPPGYVTPKVFTPTHLLQPVVVHGPEWFEPVEVELVFENFSGKHPLWRVRDRQGLEGVYTEGCISWPGTERPKQRAMFTSITSPDSKGKKFDGGKLRFSLFPQFVMRPVLEILEEGAKEYGENNWQKVEDARRRYYDALCRHLTSWWEGESIDKKSGKPHMAHIICNAAFLLWFERTAEDRTQGDKT